MRRWFLAETKHRIDLRDSWSAIMQAEGNAIFWLSHLFKWKRTACTVRAFSFQMMVKDSADLHISIEQMLVEDNVFIHEDKISIPFLQADSILHILPFKTFNLKKPCLFFFWHVSLLI